MIVTIASWYGAALLLAAAHINGLLALVFGAMDVVMRVTYAALITFFLGTGASRFLFA